MRITKLNVACYCLVLAPLGCFALSAQTAKPAPVSDSLRKQLLEVRESIWRAKFVSDPSLIPPEAIAINEWTDEWSHRDKIMADGKNALANGLKIPHLEFPKTEIQLYGDTAILYSTFIYESGDNTHPVSLETGRSTEIFVRRHGKWLNAGWHVDSGTHLLPHEEGDLRKTLLALRESVWRAYFGNDAAFLNQTLRPSMVTLSDPQAGLKNLTELLADSRKLAEQSVRLVSLEFPHTEMRFYEQTAVLYSDYRYQTEAGGVRSAPVFGTATEIFVYRGGNWYQVGWHHALSHSSSTER